MSTLNNIVVRKYGGTSVANKNFRKKIASDAVKLLNQGKKLVLVVSAMGRKGDPYATDSLLNLLDNKTLDKRNSDLLISCGEVITSTLVVDEIISLGYNAIALNGMQAGIITNNNYGNADIVEVKSDKINCLLDENYIVVVTGFQGVNYENEITTLGRGGSDTTAAILGEALNASKIEIYTDVDGIMTADPRIVSDAKILKNINYDEMFQLAKDGAKVVDHKAVDIARRCNKSLVIKNTFSDAKGTEISNSESNQNLYSITNLSNLIQITVFAKGNQNDFLYDLEENNISIDLINFFEDKKVFTIKDSDLAMAEQIFKNNYEYRYVKNCSKITVVGHKMHGESGFMKRIVMALTEENINILQTADSHMTISCLINSENECKAVKRLHKEFNS